MMKWTPSLSGMNEEVQNIEARRQSGFMPALPQSFLQVRTWDSVCVRFVSRAFEEFSSFSSSVWNV